jgi:hypothetical protein
MTAAMDWTPLRIQTDLIAGTANGSITLLRDKERTVAGRTINACCRANYLNHCHVGHGISNRRGPRPLLFLLRNN